MISIRLIVLLALSGAHGFSTSPLSPLTTSRTRHTFPLCSEATDTETSFSVAADQAVSFTSDPTRVYIEDTDAYGIIYNSNYLRMFDRALFDSGNQDVLGDNWSIVSVGNEKFVSSPTLGSDVKIQGQLKESFSSTGGVKWSVWDMEMVSPDGSQTYNVVTDLVVASSGGVGDVSKLKEILPATSFSSADDGSDEDGEDTALNTVLCSEATTIQRDELDAHAPGRLPLRTILNYFERSRTNLFGGPNNLRKLQDEGGILAVVTNVRDLSLIWEDSDDDSTCSPTAVVAGDEIEVQCTVEVKRKGMILEFYQSLFLPREGKTIARGQVNLMLIDAEKNRPTSKLPAWAKELLQIP